MPTVQGTSRWYAAEFVTLLLHTKPALPYPHVLEPDDVLYGIWKTLVFEEPVDVAYGVFG